MCPREEEPIPSNWQNESTRWEPGEGEGWGKAETVARSGSGQDYGLTRIHESNDGMLWNQPGRGHMGQGRFVSRL